MIVILGCPAARASERGVDVGGLAGWIALGAAGAGATTQLVGRIGDDPAGDALVLALGRAGIGHAAVLRDAANPTLILPTQTSGDEADDLRTESSEPAESAPGPDSAALRLDAADVALGLRYLTDFAVLVIADQLDPDAAGAAYEAAAFASARAVAVTRGAPDPRAEDAFEAPAGDGESFGRLLGRYAAGLDRGVAPEAAFTAAVRDSGWTRALGE
ncbi:MAG: hypothetical protein FJ038_10495 [Chloroflexi bacterium]|nr:hypothetical protein [Chloroflexota bacterium]